MVYDFEKTQDTTTIEEASGTKNKILRWLYSTKNIAGCSIAMAAPVLAVTGVVAPPVALALLPALYAVGALAAPGYSKDALNFHVSTSADIEKSLLETRWSVKSKTSSKVRAEVEQICRNIEQLLPYINKLGMSSPEMHIIIQTATDYLPSTLAPYLALPKFYAEHTILTTGKTAETTVCEQLVVINERIEDVADAVAKADSDRLLANGRFLEEKFGTTGMELPGVTGGENNSE